MSEMFPEQGGGVPPEIMQLLAGGAGAGEVAQPEEPQMSDEDMVSEIIRLAKALADSDGKVTEQERMLFEKISVSARQFLVGREKEEQAALGGGPATNFLRRASGG